MLTALMQPLVADPSAPIGRAPSPRVSLAARLRTAATPERAFATGAAVYMSLCFFAYWVVRPTTLFYFTDYWEHRAIVAEVIRHGVHVVDPIYGEGAPSRQFTPWSLALGFFARVSGIGLDDTMAIGGLLVSALFVFGVYALGRSYYVHRWAPAVLLGVLTCAWGVPAIIWTGFHPLRSQLHGNYYPAAFTLALTLIAWAAAVRLLRANGTDLRLGAIAVMLAALVAVSLITHPLNAAFQIAGAGALALFEPGARRARRPLVLLALAAGVAASTRWPYFNPLALAGPGVVRGKATFNDFAFFYDPVFVLMLMAPAAFSLCAVRAQLRDPRTRIPVIACFVTFAAYVAGAVANVSVSHRLLAFVALALQMMLAWIILGTIDGRPPAPLSQISSKGWRIATRTAAALVAIQILLAIQQLLQPWALANIRYPERPVDAEMRRVRASLSPNARVLAWDSAALMLPAYGVKVVSFPRPMPLSPSDPARQADVRRVFSSATSDCARRAIIERWRATHVAWLDLEVTEPLQRTLGGMGPVSMPASSWRIIPAPRPCAPRHAS